MPRKIVLDIETTGHSPDGQRIVELTAIEMIGNTATGIEFHVVLNPECDIQPDAVKIHGITNDVAAKKPFFAEVAQELKRFIGDSPILIAGDGSDIKLLNAEMEHAGFSSFKSDQWVNLQNWASDLFGAGKMTTDKLMQYYRVDRTRYAHDKCKSAYDARLLSKLYPKILNDYKKHLERQSLLLPELKTNPPKP